MAENTRLAHRAQDRRSTSKIRNAYIAAIGTLPTFLVGTGAGSCRGERNGGTGAPYSGADSSPASLMPFCAVTCASAPQRRRSSSSSRMRTRPSATLIPRGCASDGGPAGPEHLREFLGWNNTPPTFARVNLLKATPEQVAARWEEEKVRFIPKQFDWAPRDVVFELEYASAPSGDDQLSRRIILRPQDPSTLLAVTMMKPQPGEAVLDLCSAPGGKTTFAAQLMENRGVIMAQDPPHAPAQTGAGKLRTAWGHMRPTIRACRRYEPGVEHALRSRPGGCPVLQYRRAAATG